MTMLDSGPARARPARTALNQRLLRVTAALLAASSAPTVAWAQSASQTPPPVRSTFDDNGVDLSTGTLTRTFGQVSIGDANSGGLSYARILLNGRYRDTVSGEVRIDQSSNTATVTIGGASHIFTVTSGGTYVSSAGNGETLAAAGGGYVYTAADGMVATFRSVPFTGATNQVYYVYGTSNLNGGLLTQLKLPNGITRTYSYDTRLVTVASTPSGPVQVELDRLRSISSSAGYRLLFAYQNENPQGQNDIGQALWLTKVSGYNLLVDSCTASACTATGDRPSVTISGVGSSPVTYTDALGRITKVAAGSTITVTRPSSATPNITATLDSSNRVSQVVADGVTTTYSYSLDAASNLTTTVTRGSLRPRTVKFNAGTGLVSSDTDEIGKTTSFSYNGLQQLTQITYPESNSIILDPDARGNIKSRTSRAKPGSNVPDLVWSASYPTDCANPRTCNQPISTTEPGGATTNYAYDPNTGLVTTVTRPAPTAGAVRPETRYSYTQTNGASLLTGVSTCQVNASCVGTSDEIRTTVGYDSNMRPTSITQGAGDGSVSATIGYGYDAVGNATSIDGSIAGTADTTQMSYDAMRELVQRTGPDPDGSGPLKNRALRYSYNPDGQVTSIGQGTANSDGTGFSALQQVDTRYDNAARKAQESLSAAGTIYALTQYSYDGVGRLDCTAVRMTQGHFGAPPAAACTADPTPGSFGPDRISQNSYDDADHIIAITSALGTADQQVERSTYTPNGLVRSVSDGKDNLTTYVYDGLDRLSQTQFPNPSAGGSSTTDTEQLTYDAAGNVGARKLRNGSTISYAYDALHRVTGKTLPTGNANLNPSFSYDLLGRLTGTSNSNGVYNTSDSFTYDALGRKLTETNVLNGVARSMAKQYDLAQNQMKMIWSDGFSVTYDFNPAGEMVAVRENGATSGTGVLARFSYDDLGRRTALTRGNGTTTSYSYDPASRLSTLSHDLAGTGDDLTLSFGSYSPSGQIGSRTSSNDLYAYTAAANGTASYTPDGLNRYKPTAASAAADYDPRGNMIQLGSNTFSYSAENELALVNNTNRLYYDALHRLVYSTSAAIRFEWDGTDDMTTIYDASGNIQRRFVHGAGVDEPLVWYEGSGTLDRRWLYADERGSIVATANASGQRLAANAYDEFGVPQAGNSGRFQYTGQLWLPELGMYYYKARIYAPSIGRFMQTDPIGYADGLNAYDYTHADPINNVDPTGTENCPIGSAVLGGQCISPQQLNSYCNQNPNECITVTARRPTQGWITFSPGATGPQGGGPGVGGSGGGRVIAQKQENGDRRPDYCGSTLFQLGKIANDLGEFGDKVSTAFVVAGVVSGGTGLVPALGFRAASGVAQVGGAALQALAGDPTAGRRAIAGAIGTFLPSGLVPKSLRNDLADLVADKAFGGAMDAVNPKSQCSRFAN